MNLQRSWSVTPGSVETESCEVKSKGRRRPETTASEEMSAEVGVEFAARQGPPNGEEIKNGEGVRCRSAIGRRWAWVPRYLRIKTVRPCPFVPPMDRRRQAWERR